MRWKDRLIEGALIVASAVSLVVAVVELCRTIARLF